MSVLVLGTYRSCCCRAVVIVLRVGRERIWSGRTFILCLKTVVTKLKVTRSFIQKDFNSFDNGVTLSYFRAVPSAVLIAKFCTFCPLLSRVELVVPHMVMPQLMALSASV